MQWFELAGAILFSVGSAGAILFALSSWLGKVWASRILERERNELSILKETFLKEHNEKRDRDDRHCTSLCCHRSSSFTNQSSLWIVSWEEF